MFKDIVTVTYEARSRTESEHSRRGFCYTGVLKNVWFAPVCDHGQPANSMEPTQLPEEEMCRTVRSLSFHIWSRSLPLCCHIPSTLFPLFVHISSTFLSKLASEMISAGRRNTILKTVALQRSGRKSSTFRPHLFRSSSTFGFRTRI